MLVPPAVSEQERERDQTAGRTRPLVIAKVSKMNRTSARNTHLVREEDLRDRVLIARVRIVNIRFGLLQFGLT